MSDVSVSFPAFLFAGAELRALPCGALWWPEQDLLLVADLHLEKGSAFALQGWLLPPHDSLDTLQRLQGAVAATGASRVAVLGDSFHDTGGPGRLEPPALELLKALLHGRQWLWVTGNHDGRSAAQLGGEAVTETEIAGICLRHEADPGCALPEISGHYHPKVRIALRTGRRVSRRCLALAGQRLVLPAYGAYAGGLPVDDPAFRRALGSWPEALVAVAEGLIRVPPRTARPDAGGIAA
ncbi:MAG: ligase-associated DNA damage response endonuclease PdeM [Sandaracinobacteroides sp.]